MGSGGLSFNRARYRRRIFRSIGPCTPDKRACQARMRALLIGTLEINRTRSRGPGFRLHYEADQQSAGLLST